MSQETKQRWYYIDRRIGINYSYIMHISSLYYAFMIYYKKHVKDVFKKKRGQG